MQLGSTLIEDTFAEAFGMRYVRLIVTAADEYWLDAGLRELAGLKNLSILDLSDTTTTDLGLKYLGGPLYRANSLEMVARSEK